jgi:hypothetical protein
MSNLYGSGCAQCNAEVAAALRDMPKMDGYLDTHGYWQRYGGCTRADRPRPYLDGEYKRFTISTVCDDDGWLAALTGRPCECDSGDAWVEVWRGKVELR